MAIQPKNIASSLNIKSKKGDHLPENITILSESLTNSTYPQNYEKKVITRTGIELFIRPIKPEDAPLLVDMFNQLSSRTRYFRFFSQLKVLPKEMLFRFTHVDYSRDMALIALDYNETVPGILAVARFFTGPSLPDAEFAVVVRDEWQGKGVGRVLLENLILYAGEKEMESMSGYVLAENIHMLSLAKTLNFYISRLPTGDQYYIKIDLKSEDVKKLRECNIGCSI